MTVSVLLATTGRPDLAERCVRSLRDTTHDIEIVAAVDADPETRLRLEPMVDLLLYSDTYRGGSRSWNDALAACSGDPVVLAADDVLWLPGWLNAALETLATLPDGWGMVGLNDGHYGAELATHYLMSRRFIIEILGGVIAWQCYKHSFNDVEANERARAAGRFAWSERARITHTHWLFGDRPQDRTDTRWLGDHASSAAVCEQRRRAGWPDVEMPVITYEKEKQHG